LDTKGNIMTPKKSLIHLAWFTLVLFCLSGLLFAFLYFNSHAGDHHIHGIRKDLAEGFGMVGLIGLILIYSRSVLKILLEEESLLSRFIPASVYDNLIGRLKKTLKFMNRSHRYLGMAAVIVFPIHALLMGVNQWNPFLILVLVVIAWQGIFGLLLASSLKSPWVKRYSRLYHAQLFTGVMIAIFAGFGHLLV